MQVYMNEKSSPLHVDSRELDRLADKDLSFVSVGALSEGIVEKQWL